MSLTFKAFLYDHSWRGDPAEIRRFTVDQDVSSSYTYLLQKVVQVFPSLTTANAVLAWTDSDGDIVTISSDEELVEALDQFEGSVFRLYIKKRPGSAITTPPSAPQSDPETPQQQPQQQGDSGTEQQQQPQSDTSTQPTFHPGVQCDGCNGPIYGTRFKCLVCRDYDLCSSCEGKGLHVDHNMLTIVDPWSYHPWGGFGYSAPWAGCRGGFGGPGPFHGRGWGGRCGGGGRGRFGGHRHPHPFPWFQGFGRGGAGCCGTQQQGGKPANTEPMDTEQQQQQQQPGPSEEERKTFLHGVGEAISGFLEPFGVKVDVDVTGSEKPKETETTTGDTPSAPSAEDGATVPDEVVEEALTQLRSMGYQDEGGWLRELVQAKGGDVAKVLDALHPTVEQA